MTTTAREDRKTGPRTAPPEPGASITPPPKLRRRPALVVAAVVVTALGCLLGAWAWSATTDTQEVLAARDTIHRGDVIEAEDIQRIRISGDPALSPLPASAYDDVVGQRAALDIAAGGLLTSESTADEPLPPQGQSIVGISLTPAQVPAMPLYGGDKVRIIVTPGDNGDAPAERAAVHRRRGRRHLPRRDHRQHGRQRPGPVRRCGRPRGPRRHRQRRAGAGLREPNDGRHLPDLCIRLARRHHDGRRASRSAGRARCFSSRPTRPAVPGSSPASCAGTTPYDAGLIELALSPLGAADALRDVVRPLSPSVSLVAGTRTHAQAAALRDVWEPLGVALANWRPTARTSSSTPADSVSPGSPQPLLDAADVTLLVTRATLPSISAARSWAETVRQPATGWRHPGLLLIGEGQPYRDTEVSKVLGMPVVADLPDDPAAAAVYHRGATPPRHFETGPYVRGLQAAAQSVQAHVARGRFALVEEADPMSEASRYLNEYGDLSRLPLFSQPTNGSTPAPSALDTPVSRVADCRPPTSTGRSSRRSAPRHPSS